MGSKFKATGPESGPRPGERSPWRSVALPTEHGGWGLTLEPVLLGLLIAPSGPGVAIGLAALLTFLARTPAKLVGVDLLRRRWLPRSRLAAVVAGVEVALVALLAAWATWSAGWHWWWPVLVAGPLVAVELWFDVRSRGRRLLPELSGAIGVAATVAAIVAADDGSTRLATACWLMLAARSVGSIPFVRTQLARSRHGHADLRGSDLAQLAAIAIAGVAVVVDRKLLVGAVGVAILAGLQAWWSRRDPPPAKVIGLTQMALGLVLVVAAAAG